MRSLFMIFIMLLNLAQATDSAISLTASTEPQFTAEVVDNVRNYEITFRDAKTKKNIGVFKTPLAVLFHESIWLTHKSFKNSVQAYITSAINGKFYEVNVFIPNFPQQKLFPQQSSPLCTFVGEGDSIFDAELSEKAIEFLRFSKGSHKTHALQIDINNQWKNCFEFN